MVDPTFVGPDLNIKFTRVLIDNGSSINILYKDTMHKLGIKLSQLEPSRITLHGLCIGSCELGSRTRRSSWWEPGPSWAILPLSDHAIIPAALPSGVVGRPPGVRCVVAARSIHHLLVRECCSVIPGSVLVKPLPPVVLVLAP